MPMRIGHNARTAGERQVRWRALSKLSLAIALVGASLLAAAPVALAHAQLLGTSPLSGIDRSQAARRGHLQVQPGRSAARSGAVRVYNAQGEEVDNLDVGHPEGKQHWMGVGLKPSLPDGTYTGHLSRDLGRHAHRLRRPRVQHRSRRRGAEVHGGGADRSQQERPRSRRSPSGSCAALDYVSLALGIGGLVFLLWAWLPALAAADWRTRPDGETASRAFARRAAASAFASPRCWASLVSVLGILLQGANAAGVSLWASLKGTIAQRHPEKPLRRDLGVARDRVGGVRRPARAATRRAAMRGARPCA